MKRLLSLGTLLLCPLLTSGMSLSEALDYALDHNQDIITTREAVRVQEGVLVTARGQRKPNLALSGQYQRNDEELARSLVPTDESWNLNLQVTQVLYAGGGLTAGVAAQDAQVQAAVLDLQSVIENVLLQVRVQYLQTLLARENIGVQEANVKLLEDRLGEVRDRFEAGVVSNFDVLRADVALANAQPALIQARNAYRAAIADLRLLLGMEALDTLEVEGELQTQPFNIELATAQQTALANRVEIAAAAKRVEAGAYGIDRAKAGYRPTVSAFAGYQLQQAVDGLGSRGGDADHGWVAGVSTSWDVWDSGRTKGEVLSAMAQRRQAETAVARTRLGVSVEVEKAYLDLRAARELLEATRRTVEQAEEGLRLAEERYAQGVGIQLDVLDAQVALTQARTNVLDANFRHLAAVARLQRAMGTADAVTITDTAE